MSKRFLMVTALLLALGVGCGGDDGEKAGGDFPKEFDAFNGKGVSLAANLCPCDAFRNATFPDDPDDCEATLSWLPSERACALSAYQLDEAASRVHFECFGSIFDAYRDCIDALTCGEGAVTDAVACGATAETAGEACPALPTTLEDALSNCDST